jgi:hypothetical protein
MTISFIFQETYFGENSWLVNFTLFSALILLGLEILTYLVQFLFVNSNKIPIKGKHLDELETIDNSYIFINKLLTISFVYNLIDVDMDFI